MSQAAALTQASIPVPGLPKEVNTDRICFQGFTVQPISGSREMERSLLCDLSTLAP